MTNAVRLVAIGDLMLSGTILTRLHTQNDYFAIYKIKNIFMDSGIVFGNLETPLMNKFSFQYIDGFPKFAAPTSFAEVLAQADFDVLSLLNNHILDQGIEGLLLGVQPNASFHEGLKRLWSGS